MNTSATNPDTPNGFNGSPHGGRICDVDGLGTTDERITGYVARTPLRTMLGKSAPRLRGDLKKRAE